MIPLSIVGLRVEVLSNQPIVLLREEAPGGRYLPIVIGHTEAVAAIACAFQGVVLPRPMTHDLLKGVLDELAACVDRVVISELREGTFYAELEVLREGDRHRISARPSDALALAVRYEKTVPIVADDVVVEEAGVVIIEGDDEAEDEEEQVKRLREFLEGVAPEDFAS